MIPQEELTGLVCEAIEGQVVGDEDRVVDALRTVLVGGSRYDALAFTVGCVFALASLMVAGQSYIVGPVAISTQGAVSLTETVLPAGRQLFAEVLGDYLSLATGNIPIRWAVANDDEVAGAVGTAVAAAGLLTKQRRAIYN